MAKNERRRVGAWLIGARGAISTCVVYGLAGLRKGMLEPVGLATERGPLAGLPCFDLEDLVLGGHEIARGDLSSSAAELVQHGVLPRELVAACAQEAARHDARVRPGILDLPDVGAKNLHPEVTRLSSSSLRIQVDRLRADIEEFRSSNELDRVIVVELASTEAWREDVPALASLEAFERGLDEGSEIPASCLYAYAAFRAGAPFVNFTPNRAASAPALRELALELRLPHCGSDGKTGETLLKTSLAPMFAARALKVLAWQGYNMLGNRDGATLADPGKSLAKRRNKDQALREILGDESTHTHVGIDFVPSLHDWKTAFDHVHFEGFLGAKMTLSFIWTGSDSALAAPLVLDLVRLADLAAARGENGEMDHVACFFKSPLAGGTHDFHVQWRRLLDYAEGVLGK